MNEWKPVETAPNDESILIHRDDGSIEIVQADDNDYTWEPYDGKKIIGVGRVTHWMLLPAAPPT